MPSCPELWEKVCGKLHEKVDTDSWERYLAGIVPVSLDQTSGEMTLGVLNDFVALWLDSNYKGLIEELLAAEDGKFPVKLQARFVGGYEPLRPVAEAADSAAAAAEESRSGSRSHIAAGRRGGSAAAKSSTKALLKALQLRPDFTFENFVVGDDSNKVSVAAAKAVASDPGKSYNPFFVYGRTGLGKTHLLQAIAHEVIRKRAKSKIEYLTSEEFVNLYVEAVQKNTLTKFRRHFRSLDLLLIDDVQFFQDKVGTTKEFFHTFNSLHNGHKQIVLAADRTPQEIGLEDRMVSRFDSGLSAELLPPGLETRVAILKKKQELQSVRFSDEILFLIASRIRSNVRTLGGALTILTMNVSALGGTMTVELAEKLLKDKFENQAGRILTIDMIQKETAEHFDVKVSDILGTRRPQNIAKARMVAMFLARELSDFSYPVIGKAFNRNHATIIHAFETIRKKMNHDEVLRGIIAALTKRLKAP